MTDPATAGLLSALAGFRVHDASPVLEPSMPMFHLHQPPEITTVTGHADVGVAVNRIAVTEHTGSHVDAPYHFDPDGLTIERLPPDVLLLRPFKKFDLTPDDPQPGELVGADALEAAARRGGFELEPGDVAIVEMGWDRHWDDREFWGRNEPGLSEDACRHLAEAGVAAVASDTAGCDVACADGEVGAAHGHTTWFLPRGILIVEGLRGLAEVAPTGLFVAVPLKIAGGTGSPVRVLLLDRP